VILERLDSDQVDWERLDAFADRVVFQTREWVEFVASCQGAEPVIAALKDGSTTAGYLTALIVRRYGIPILGSPMPGWTTSFMGFNLEDGVSRRDAVEALLEFAFSSLGCRHVEFRDHDIGLADVEGLGFEHTPWRGLQVDLRQPEEQIWAGMKSECRTAIRKAERSGVVSRRRAISASRTTTTPSSRTCSRSNRWCRRTMSRGFARSFATSIPPDGCCCFARGAQRASASQPGSFRQ